MCSTDEDQKVVVITAKVRNSKRPPHRITIRSVTSLATVGDQLDSQIGVKRHVVRKMLGSCCRVLL